MNLQHEKHLFYNALMFYSRLPVPSDTPYSPELLNQSRKYFPCVGILIGAICSLVFLLADALLPVAIAVLLSMIAGVLATGAFHEDGFADSCDALGGGWEPEQILTIMKDSRIGTYGTVGLISIMTLKYLALLELAQAGAWLWCLSVIAAHALSRLNSSRQIKFFAYVQDIDKSKIKPIADGQLSQEDERIALVSALAPCFLLMLVALPATLLAMAGSYWSANKFMRYCNRRLGGYTGDILGAVQQLSEVVFLLSLVLLIAP